MNSFFLTSAIHGRNVAQDFIKKPVKLSFPVKKITNHVFKNLLFSFLDFFFASKQILQNR